MMIDLTLDLGNVWQMLSAIGTLLAVIVSLWLAYGSNRSKVRVKLGTALLTDGSQWYYTVTAINVGNRDVTITEIGLFFKKVKQRVSNTTIFDDSMKIDEHTYPKKLAESEKVEIYIDRDGMNYSIKKHDLKGKISGYVIDSTGKMWRSKGSKVLF